VRARNPAAKPFQSAVTSAVTLDLVQQLGTERLEEMPDHAVLREELTLELTSQTRRRFSSYDR
jgi:hypothetical protein